MKVEVYGGDHSSWVQAVTLALHENGIEYRLRWLPPFEAFKQWTGLMQQRFCDYPHLYSGRYFAPDMPQPATASPLQQVIFYLGLLMMIAAFPLTIALVFVLMRKVRR